MVVRLHLKLQVISSKDKERKHYLQTLSKSSTPQTENDQFGKLLERHIIFLLCSCSQSFGDGIPS